VTPKVEWREQTITTENTEWHISLDHLYLLMSPDINRYPDCDRLMSKPLPVQQQRTINHRDNSASGWMMATC